MVEQSCESWEHVLDSFPANVAIIDRSGIIVRVNQPWLDFARHNGGDFQGYLGTNYLDVCRNARGYGSEIAMEAFRGIRTILDGISGQFDLEYPCHSPDEYRWYLLRATALVDGTGAILSHIDITRLKQAEKALRISEERYRSLFDLLIEGMVTHEAVRNELGETVDYRFLEVNPTFERITTLTRDELLGRGVRDVPLSEYIDWFEIYRSVEKNDGPISIEKYVAPIDKYFIVTAYKYSTDCYATLFVDITAFKQAEEQVAELNVVLEKRVADRTIQLEAANRELTAFSYSVSHDLRAPLRHIEGFTKLLSESLEGPVKPESARYLEIIRQSVNQMSSLIDDLLSLSRVDRQRMREQTVDMDLVVDDVLSDMQETVQKRSIEIIREPLPQAWGDPGLLRQVWENLITNAVKFTKTIPGPRIKIGSIGGEDGKSVYFIEDNGVGFDMQYANRLFGVFQRLHSAEQFEGTGVGLAMAQRIIHRHGGQIWVEAAPKRGATFFFTVGDIQ